MSCDGFVYVYCDNKETLFLATDILINHLPDETRQQILDGKFLKTEEEVYNFLESYSS